MLVAAAWQRGAEYDEQYTLFLTAGTPRPQWPETVFAAGVIAAVQAGHTTMPAIAHDLRTTDVHPPLYFWMMGLWRRVFGPGLLAARMMSVLCGLMSLWLVGVIAERCAVPALLPMLLTLGCYGFVYTNAIARNFAPAQVLTLGGVACLFGRRPRLAGACLGAACCCNYLAVFVAAGVVVAAGAWLAVWPAVPFLALDAWFFAAQHDARTGQFPPFQLGPSLLRLGEYQTAAVFGGLPVYFDGIGRIAVTTLIALCAVMLVLRIGQARPFSARPSIRVILGAAIAPPLGLLLLGAIFDNTPIEMRYLSFGLPYIALLTAWAATPGLRQPRARPGYRVGVTWLSAATAWAGGHVAKQMVWHRISGRPPLTSVILIIQTASITGLLLSARSMQPMRAAAIAAAQAVGDGIVLVPRGNDGVGIVGAFGIEAPPALPILPVRPTDPITDRIAAYHRVVLAILPQDHDSIAAIARVRAALVLPNWHPVAIGSNVEVYERTDKGE